MKVINYRNLDADRNVKFHAGISRRILLEKDGLGFGLTRTTIFPEAGKVFQHYKHHEEACYCIQGRGILTDKDGFEHSVTPGVSYILDENDPHWFQALEEVVLICVFNPPLKGAEIHQEDGSYSILEAC